MKKVVIDVPYSSSIDNLTQADEPLSTFNLYQTYYSTLIEYIKPFVDEQLSPLPNSVFQRYHTFKRFTKVIDEIALMAGAFEIANSKIPNEIIDQIWHDVKHNSFQKILSYITHNEYFPNSPFNLSFREISEKYSIPILISSRCVYDCCIHYIREQWANRHQPSNQ